MAAAQWRALRGRKWSMMEDTLDRASIERIVHAALEEDAAGQDVTSSLLTLAGESIGAHILTRSPGVIAGLDVAAAAFNLIDPAIGFEALVEDGAEVRGDTVLVALRGDAAAIMAAERTALNFLQRLSGIATLTRAYVRAVAGTGVTVLDTRKTTPLLREFEKYAVRTGGGGNHRGDLREMVLIKENHIRSAGGIGRVVRLLSEASARVPVEVEVDSLEQLRTFLGAPADRIMLDNFSPEDVVKALELIEQHRRKRGGRTPEVEISGGITLDNITRYALPGVHYISIGALTHSAPVLDLTLEVDRED